MAAIISPPRFDRPTAHPTVAVPGYDSVESWALDSDFYPDYDEDAVSPWVDEVGNPVDILDACVEAHEASGERLGRRFHLLSETDPRCDDSVRASLFGAMIATLPAGTIEHYHSDLYRDVQWIDTYVTGPMTFWWLVHDCGSHIGDGGAARDHLLRAGSSTMIGWTVELRLDRHTWSAIITPLDKPESPK